MTSPLRIGLVQIDIAWENPAANLNALNRLLKNQDDLDLIVLPEMWSTGFTMDTEQASEGTNGPAFQWMAEKAASLKAQIAGSLSISDQGKYFNRFFCVSPDGSFVQYDKRHLFSYGKEDHHYTSGCKPLIFQVGDWKIRAIVCYDLRFPVWCRNTQDYDVMLVVANWPEVRIHHWDALLRARAIENQSYVVGVNRIGTDGNGLAYNGHSSVYDMNGSLILDLEAREGVESIELKKDALTSFRQQFRFLQDRDPFTL